MSNSAAWERFARTFSAVLVVVFILVGFLVTFRDESRERFIFPISAMHMFRKVPILNDDQIKIIRDLE